MFTLNAYNIFTAGRYEGKVVLKSLIKNITATFVKTTWMQKVEASLGEINVLDCSTSADPLHLVSSPSEGIFCLSCFELRVELIFCFSLNMFRDILGLVMIPLPRVVLTSKAV